MSISTHPYTYSVLSARDVALEITLKIQHKICSPTFPQPFFLQDPFFCRRQKKIEHINYFLLVFLLGGKGIVWKNDWTGFFFVIKRAIFVVENHHTIKLILQINRSNTVIWTTEWKEATITKHPISFATKSQNISLTLCPLFRKRWDLEGGSGLARDVLNF